MSRDSNCCLQHDELKDLERRLLSKTLLSGLIVILIVSMCLPSVVWSLSLADRPKVDGRSYAQLLESADVELARGNWRSAIGSFEDALLTAKRLHVEESVLADLCLRSAECLAEYGHEMQPAETASSSADTRELARSAQFFYNNALNYYTHSGDKKGQYAVYQARSRTVVSLLMTEDQKRADKINAQRLSEEETSVSASR